MEHRPLSVLLLASSLFVALPAAASAAQGRRLSGPMPPAIAGDVQALAVSPDGSRVVFVANADQVDVLELYSAPIGGGMPVKLNPPLVAGGDLSLDEPLFTADSARVIYRADQDVDDVVELYSVPIGGGAATKLSGTLTPGADVNSAKVSPTTGRVAYLVLGGGNPRLYSVPSAGGVPPTRIDAGATFEGVGSFAISNDGLGLAYTSDGIVDGRFDLWVARMDGTLAPQLRSGNGVGTGVGLFHFAPGDTHLVYRAANGNLFGADVYSVPVVGGAPTRLNPALPPGQTAHDIAISPDGSRVVYRVSAEGVPIGLYSVPIGGGAVTELSASNVFSFAIGGASPTRVIYLDNADGNAKNDLHTIPIEGGASFQYSYPNTSADRFSISADGARVVFLGIDTAASWEPYRLHSAPLEGGPVVRLNTVAFSDSSVSSFEIAPDSESVLYVADQATLGTKELWIAPIAGGGNTRLNAEFVFESDVESARFDPSGTRIVYVADQDTDEARELYSVPSAGGTPTKLNPPLATLAPEGDVRAAFRLRPDGGRAVYIADQAADEVDELWTVSTAGGAPTRVNATLAPGGDVTAFEVSPDWSRVVYLADQDEDGSFRLFSAPLDGGAAIALDGGPVFGGDVEGFAVSPDSTRVVYLADQVEDERFELYSVPIGGGAAVRLNGTLVLEGDVREALFRIAPDSSRVVYVADQVANEVAELWGVPLAGGPAVRLSAPLVLGENVTAVEIAADSSRAVYLADQDVNEVFELWSAPLAGGTPVRLSGTMAVGGDVSAFLLAPDSSRAVYRADQDQNEVFELFSTPLAGGAATQLNGPMAPGGDVQAGAFAFEISADSSRVLYRADESADFLVELWSVPIAGGTPVRLNGPLPLSGGVADFRIAPDSARAVYRANQDTSDIAELYSVAFETGTITRLHAPLVGNGRTSANYLVTPDSQHVVVASPLLENDVRVWALPMSGAGARSLSGPLDGDDVRSPMAAGGGRVLYVADQAMNAVFELFAAALPRGLRQGSVPPGH